MSPQAVGCAAGPSRCVDTASVDSGEEGEGVVQGMGLGQSRGAFSEVVRGLRNPIGTGGRVENGRGNGARGEMALWSRARHKVPLSQQRDPQQPYVWSRARELANASLIGAQTPRAVWRKDGVGSVASTARVRGIRAQCDTDPDSRLAMACPGDNAEQWIPQHAVHRRITRILWSQRRAVLAHRGIALAAKLPRWRIGVGMQVLHPPRIMELWDAPGGCGGAQGGSRDPRLGIEDLYRPAYSPYVDVPGVSMLLEAEG